MGSKSSFQGINNTVYLLEEKRIEKRIRKIFKILEIYVTI